MDKSDRFYMNWAIEAAEARRDQWLERANDKAIDIEDVYEEKASAASTIADGIGIGITAMKEVVTKQEALMAMMIYEVALSARWYVGPQGGGLRASPVLDWLCAEEGSYEARDNALLIAPRVCKASDAIYAKGYDLPEDWNFLPPFLDSLIETSNKPDDVNDFDCQRAAEVVLKEYEEDKNA